MSNPALENGLAALGFARQVTLGLLEDIPEGRLLHQLSPDGNHAVWVIGHLAVTDEVFLTDVAGGEAVPGGVAQARWDRIQADGQSG